jgi:hypothetical protein
VAVRLRRGGWMIGVTVLLVALGIELLAWAGAAWLARSDWLFVPADPEVHARALASRDPLLGWPRPARVGRDLDAWGARRVDGAEPGPPCAAAFGDSFTFGDEIAAADAWPHRLGRHLGCPVANLGMSAYGTDQAFLRYRDRFDEPVEVALLAHFSGDLLRNVNRYRRFFTNRNAFWKPRFVLGPGGDLELLPMPDAPPADPLRADRADVLRHEWFAPGGPAGAVADGFPRAFALARLARRWPRRAQWSRRELGAAYYAPGHPSGALPLTVAIVEAFAAEARRRGQRPAVLLIPEQAHWRAARAGAPLPTDSLARALDAAGAPRVGLVEALTAELGERDPCAFYLRCDGGHMSPAGHEAIARAVEAWLRGQGWSRDGGGGRPRP